MSVLTTAHARHETTEVAHDCGRFAKSPSIQNILVAIDFSDCSKAALRYATFVAESFNATLMLVHVTEPYIYPEDLSDRVPIDELDVRWIAKQKEKLEAVRQTVKEGIPVSVVVATGTVWHEIIEMAKRWNADLIITGTHGRTFKHTLIGSTAERVTRHARCPVLVVPLP